MNAHHLIKRAALVCCFSTSLCFQLAAAAEEESKPSASPTVTIVTANDEKVAGPLAEVRDGVLRLETMPPRSIDLLDLQSLTFGGSVVAAAQWLGQDQHDFVQVGAVQAGNGIQDVHLRLTGLQKQKGIKQLRIVLRTPPRAWVMDPSDSPNWRLAVQRSANSTTADVYFEPPAGDLLDKELQVTVTYEDDSTEKLTCVGKSHTSDQLKMGGVATEGGTTKASEQRVTVDLGSADSLRGTLASMTDDALTLQTKWDPNLQIPLLQVQGLLSARATNEARKRYDAARAKPGSDDLALVIAKDGNLTEIAGRVKQWEGNQLRFVYEGEEHTIPGDRLQAIVFAAHPANRSASTAVQIVHLNSGDKLSGKWTGIKGSNISLQMPWDQTWELPIDSVVEISTRNGNLVQLSDLEPSAVEQTPYFGRLMPYKRDVSLEGEPLKMKGKSYSKGLAVHSRCVLTYDLDGQFTKFKTTVGFDEAAGNRGNVSCRVLADGKELFAKPVLKADQDPQAIDVSVKDAKSLTLEIDFGENEDVGDRVIWAEPRLFRK
jgi:NPCBM/NEW2 domain